MNNIAKEHWDNEYRQGSPHFHALASREPSSAATKFLWYMAGSDSPRPRSSPGIWMYDKGTVLEVGCGMGRNTNWLAETGLKSIGMDISSEAIEEARNRAQEAGVNVEYLVQSVADIWPFQPNSIDLVFDLVTLHLLTPQEASAYKNELCRCIKPIGRLFVYTLDRSVDECAKELLRDHPGPEPNTYFLPEINHVERTFTLDELQEVFSPLNLEYSELIKKPTRFMDKTYLRYYWWAVFGK